MEVVEDGKENRVQLGPDPVREDAADERDDDDQRAVEPVDVLVPVLEGHGLLGDVRLLDVVRL